MSSLLDLSKTLWILLEEVKDSEKLARHKL